MFIGTIPMGLATIINGCLAFGIARFGDGIVGRTSCGGSTSPWRCLRRADPYFMFTATSTAWTA
jgi:hypothetical protein